MPSHIEEDFRFTTQVEVDHYSPAELVRKPHICGFEFSQLLDQIDGRVTSSNQAGRCFRGFVRAPGGTALWLAKHLSANDFSNELLISVELASSDRLLLNELNELPNVVDAFQDSGDCIKDEYADSIDEIILACRAGLSDWFENIKSNSRLGRKPIVAYDPGRWLSEQGGGHYFMNSTVWVSLNGN